MARYVDAIDLPLPLEDAFAFFADFSRVADWDPGVVEAQRLSEGEIGEGSRFSVTVSFLGRESTLEYAITAFEPGRRLVLAGGDDRIESIDEITFVPRRGGTRVTYEARLALRGLARVADPLLDVVFQRIARVAVCGLREYLANGDPAGDPATPVGCDPGEPRLASAHEREASTSTAAGARRIALG